MYLFNGVQEYANLKGLLAIVNCLSKASILVALSKAWQKHG